MRQIVLDTETTGLEVSQGHRIIEIGCVELVNRRLTGNHYHQYINPQREIDQGAIEVHGITNEFLDDKPLFAQIIAQLCAVIDTLVMARAKHPGQRNNLDALCQRYDVDNSQRDLHGALLDAEILADVYLAMTGGQTAFQLSDATANSGDGGPGSQQIKRLGAGRPALPVIRATAAERAAHEAQLDAIAASSGGRVLWRELVERN